MLTPVLLFLATLTAEYRLQRARNLSFHHVIYRQNSLLGRITRGRVMTLIAALGMSASATLSFTVWAISADFGSIWITSVCMLCAAVGLAAILDWIETQALAPHAHHVAIGVTGWIAGILTAGWLGHYIWTTLRPPMSAPQLLERTAQQLEARHDMIGLIEAAALMINEAQLILMAQLSGVGLKFIYVVCSVLIVFLIIRSALVLVAALTVAPLRLPRGPGAGLRIAVPTATATLTGLSVLVILMMAATPIEGLAHRFAIPAGKLSRINQAVEEAYRPVHAAAEEFGAQHLRQPPGEGDAARPDQAIMTNLIHDELIAGLETRLDLVVADLGRGDVGADGKVLAQEAAQTIAQTLAVMDPLSGRRPEDMTNDIARDLCAYAELGWLRCMVVKTLAGSASATASASLSSDRQQIALHAAIEAAAERTKLQIIHATFDQSGSR